MNKSHSLKNKKIFKALFEKQQTRILNKYFVFLWNKSKSFENMKIGIVVSSKRFNAVKRNKMKRIIRVLIKKHMDLNKNYNLIIIVRRNILQEKSIVIEKEFKKCVDNLLISKKNNY